MIVLKNDRPVFSTQDPDFVEKNLLPMYCLTNSIKPVEIIVFTAEEKSDGLTQIISAVLAA
jgi:hypothetical protein